MTDPTYTGKGGGPTPFVNAFTNNTIGSFRYNTSQAGSPIPICYGTQRVTINLIEFWGFHRLERAARAARAAAGAPSGGKKGQQQYAVDAAMGICWWGPIAFTGSSLRDELGQSACGPMAGSRRGSARSGSTVISAPTGRRPDSGVREQRSEPAGDRVFRHGLYDRHPDAIGVVAGDAQCVVRDHRVLQPEPSAARIQATRRPDLIVTDLLTNARYGAGFRRPISTATSIADWGNYCQAARLGMSLLLDRQQPAARWLEEVTDLTVAAVVWWGNTLRIIPYGDQALSANGTSWTPDLTWRYSLDDGDFLPWGESGDGSTDPVVMTRSDPAQATNWLSLEYMDADNSYNPQIIAVFDQGMIDQYGLRTEPSIQAHEFTAADTSRPSRRLLQLQRQRLCPQHLPVQAGLAVLPVGTDGHRADH